MELLNTLPKGESGSRTISGAETVAGGCVGSGSGTSLSESLEDGRAAGRAACDGFATGVLEGGLAGGSEIEGRGDGSRRALSGGREVGVS